MNSKMQIPSGFKRSPIGNIPKDWDVIRLGEMCETFKSGYGITSNNITDSGNYSVYGGNGLRGYTDKYTHEGDYILIGRQGALCGNIMQITGRNFISEHAIAVQPNAQNDISFLAHKLDFINLNRLSESSAQPGLSVEKLLRVRVSRPPLSEQRNISKIVGKWDKAIYNTQQLIIAFELRNKWVRHNLLTGKKRLSGFGDVWVQYSLGELFFERNEVGHNKLRLLSIGQNGVYPQSDSEKRDISNSDKSKYRRICPGDIGYNTMRMWQGRSALSNLEGIVSPAYTIVTPKEKAYSKFFSYLFKSPNLIHQFFRHSQGLVEDTLNCKFRDFAIIKVFVPSREEQIAIAQVLESAEKEMSILNQRLLLLREQKKGMLQQLLTGKKRVKN